MITIFYAKYGIKTILKLKEDFFQSFSGMLLGGSSSMQSSIDNIQLEEPRYPFRDIRRRGCATDGHL